MDRSEGEQGFVARGSMARPMHDGVLMKNDTTSSPPRFVIVAAIDASPDAERVIGAACNFASTIAGAEVHLVHAVEHHATEAFPAAEDFARAMSRGRDFLDAQAQAARARGAFVVVGHLRQTTAAAAIVQTAVSTDADLVMVGTHDRKGLSRWAYGSVAERVARDAACPVLIVRPKHHATFRAPEIEPPCADCLRVQRETKSATLWCARHAEHHPVAHLHYEMPQGFGAGSTLIRP